MAILQQHPTVEFDPTNQQHREFYNEFNKKGKWNAVAPRFILSRPYLSVPTMIADILLNYYMEQEFTRKSTTRKNVVSLKK